LRFFRRGSSEPQPEPEEPDQPPSPGGEHDEPTADVPPGMVESLFEGDPPEPDLIGDEWQGGSPDQPVPEPTELEWDLAEAPGALLGGTGVVDPAPIIPTAEEIAEARAAGEPDPEPVPEVQWAWGADYTADKADDARRERERAALEAGLERSRDGFGARLRSAFALGLDADWDEIEETLITGDVGAELAMNLVERARKERSLTPEQAVRTELQALLAPRDADAWEPAPAVPGGPAIVLVVGVNGTGKTTTIGKLAARERAKGRRVVLAAADTFRAAAIDQLRIWAQRTDSEIVAHAQNADPAAVVFDALDAAVARNADILIADTAGRLHTKSNLMDELSKVRRVIDKRLPGAAVETFFVLDATTGQNGLVQAKAFHDAVGLTGVVLTKLDSTAKGGIVFAIEQQLGVPVRFVGVGEQASDLLPFDPDSFVAALFD
jgi:fused signal recognition particle receptor